MTAFGYRPRRWRWSNLRWLRARRARNARHAWYVEAIIREVRRDFYGL